MCQRHAVCLLIKEVDFTFSREALLFFFSQCIYLFIFSMDLLFQLMKKKSGQG